jgi:hypothetical protein
MAPAEVLKHARRATTARIEDAAFRAARPVWRRRWRVADRLPVAFDRTTSVGPLTQESVDLVVHELHASEVGIRAAATRWLEGRVSLLGYGDIEIGDAGPALDHDPISGRRWPARDGRLIDYRHDAPGDPKLVWELNRCQELPLLVLAGRLTGDERYTDAAISRLLAWVAHHPPGRGIAWANAFEPGIRAISLAVTLDALRGHPALSGEQASTVVRSLWQHGRWISRGLSSHSSANNHLVGELVGLLAVGTLVPELADAAAWRRRALDGIVREAERQILPDGMGAEQAFAYGLFTTDLLLTAASLVTSAGEHVPELLRERLRAAADGLSLVVAGDEPDPAFGDDDDGRALLLDGAHKRDARGVAASLAAALGHPGAAHLAGRVDVTAALLFGRDGLDRFAAALRAPSPAQGDGLLPDGGLVVMRRDGARALFDVGPLGYLSIAAHGHADALQVDVSRGERELLADPGAGSYFGNPALRTQMRGTRAHATVAVDGLDQSRQGGPFLWTTHARCRLIAEDLRQGWAVGEHNGYAALDPPVSHRRALIAFPERGFLVVDRLACKARRTYEQTWPLAPGLEPAVDGARVVVRAGDEQVLVLHLAATAPVELVARRDGFHSRRLESHQPVWTVRAVAAVTGPVELATLLLLLDQAEVAPTAIALDHGDEQTTIRVAVGAWHAVFGVALGHPVPAVTSL